MKLLYLSSYHCHLERMELELFHELGIEFLSTGKFLTPKQPRFDSLAAPLDIDVNQDLANEFKKQNPRQIIWQTPRLSAGFVNKFDCVYIGHCGPNQVYLRALWPQVKHKPIIYRTYGLQSPSQELFAKQYQADSTFYAVRFSKREEAIENSARTDAVILPWVDETAFKDWNGSQIQLLTFQNWFSSRSKIEPTAYALFNKITQLFNRRVHGISSLNGTVTPDKQKELYRNSRVYFSLGTAPSPITINCFEALMTGMPVVTWNKLGNGKPEMYQIPEMITNYQTGLCSDDENEIKAFISKCYTDYDYAKTIGNAAREYALKTFSKAAIKPLWEAFFKDKGLL